MYATKSVYLRWRSCRSGSNFITSTRDYKRVSRINIPNSSTNRNPYRVIQKIQKRWHLKDGLLRKDVAVQAVDEKINM